MTIIRKGSALTTLALGALLHLSSFAQASGPDQASGPPMGMQTPMPAGERMHGMLGGPKMREKQEARHLKHLEELKVFLQLQATQEAAWNEFSGIMKIPMKRPSPMQKSEVEKLSTPERIDKMMAFKAERDTDMNQKMAATKKFYASLTPVQQKVFDTHTQKFMEKGPMGHHGKMHP